MISSSVNSWALFQHTAARRRLGVRRVQFVQPVFVSTHSRPKAAGFCDFFQRCALRCFNTQPPEGGWKVKGFMGLPRSLFQHTAARRRLDNPYYYTKRMKNVSTHSRPKAAG